MNNNGESSVKIKTTDNSDGTFDVSIACQMCGEPIIKTGFFGMDCKNDCNKKTVQAFFDGKNFKL